MYYVNIIVIMFRTLGYNKLLNGYYKKKVYIYSWIDVRPSTKIPGMYNNNNNSNNYY